VVNIPVGRSNYRRNVAIEASIDLHNRFFEQNPVLNQSEDFPALIARPGMRKIAEVGSGHIRFVFSEAGTFDDDAFIVSGLVLYRMDRYGVATSIGTISNDVLGGVSMAATGAIGETPSYLFIADGGVLWVYTENGSAVGTLTGTAVANNDTVEIGGVYYLWTNASVDASTPAGTLANPWRVLLGANISASLNNLYYAINAGGGAGTTYSTALTAHPTVASNVQTGDDLYVVAREAGTAGNSISTTETGANIAWGDTTLNDGGTDQLRQVGMPDDVGAISVAHFNSYILVAPVQGNDVNGRFYWIDPGETFVDPLNFATAERSPDPINQIVALSDRFWLLGQSSSEPWITTGNIDAPMIRMQGILYEQGAWPGTGVKVNNGIILVDQFGDVYQVAGGLKMISRPDIAEVIREAIAYQQAFGG